MCWVPPPTAARRGTRRVARASRASDGVADDGGRDQARRTRPRSPSSSGPSGACGSDELDASLLVIPLVGFLSGADGVFRRTVLAIENELTVAGVALRRRPRQRAGRRQACAVCSWWLVSALVTIGEIERAHALAERLLAYFDRRPLRGASRPCLRTSTRQLPARAHPSRAHRRALAADPRRAVSTQTLSCTRSRRWRTRAVFVRFSCGLRRLLPHPIRLIELPFPAARVLSAPDHASRERSLDELQGFRVSIELKSSGRSGRVPGPVPRARHRGAPCVGCASSCGTRSGRSRRPPPRSASPSSTASGVHEERGLWAAHPPPELGGQGFGFCQLKLGLMNEILGTSIHAPEWFASNGSTRGLVDGADDVHRESVARQILRAYEARSTNMPIEVRAAWAQKAARAKFAQALPRRGRNPELTDVDAVQLTAWQAEPELRDRAGSCSRPWRGAGRGRGCRSLPHRPPHHGVARRGAALGAPLHARAANSGMRPWLRDRAPPGSRSVTGWSCTGRGDAGRAGSAYAAPRTCARRGTAVVRAAASTGRRRYLLVPSTRLLVPIGDLDPTRAAPLTDAALTFTRSDHTSAGCARGVGRRHRCGWPRAPRLQILRALAPARIVAIDPQAHPRAPSRSRRAPTSRSTAPDSIPGTSSARPGAAQCSSSISSARTRRFGWRRRCSRWVAA